MAPAILSERMRNYRPGPAAQLVIALSLALAVALAAIGPDRLVAQIEGERGIAPLANSTDIQVGGIEVNTTGDTGEEARTAGWKLAQRKAWEKLGGPKMSDGQIDALVSAIVIEREMIGPRRYIARLGVIFDRAKAGQFIASAGGGSAAARSAPLLVIPVLYSGGTRQVFEVRGPWQRAWASYQSAASPIDYVRPTGAGGDSLILTAGQPGRRSRIWWRTVLDQFSAADVLIPVARLDRQWPGGPVKGTFTARYGPDNKYLDSFTLTADDENGVPAMLEKAIVRIDGIYRDALAEGLLKPDPTLFEEQRAFDAALAALRAALLPRQEQDAGVGQGPAAVQSGPAATQAAVATYTVQFVTPDAAAVDSALSAVRSVPGVQGAATTSIAIGGTSVMRVSITGNLETLAAGLRSRGWQVTMGDDALRMSR
ncbi:MAG: heavy-metal-associated domain-containing protein [Novosphingobium sp.]|nr:heavy-metal-associated domain-containing protein [Novosphingobium sp.]MCP5402946.1 heavy-metal-associated domain-containing protein [Novosphingobium sp.]